MLYQWLVPGSMFRYWLCRRGSIPDHHLYYTYVDQSNLRVGKKMFNLLLLSWKIEIWIRSV